MDNLQQQKLFFTPGDVVAVRHEIEFKPDMIVKTVQKVKVSGESRGTLLGVVCYWFTADGSYQEHLFNTKDLVILVKNVTTTTQQA
jgi:hypothetical protein